MEPTRRDFIATGISLAGVAGLALTENAANAAEPHPELAASGESLAGNAADKAQDLATATTTDKMPLTTNLGQPISTDQNSLRAGGRGPTLAGRLMCCARSFSTSIMSASRSESFTRGARRRMVIFRCINLLPTLPPPKCCMTRL